MSKAWGGVKVYRCQITERGLEQYANKVTGEEGVTLGVQYGCGYY